MGFFLRIFRLLAWLIFVVWAIWLVRRLFAVLVNPKQPRQTGPAAPLAPKQLYRDPWCGTHVSPEISHTLEQAGQVLHFCSAECRQRYLASQRRAASG